MQYLVRFITRGQGGAVEFRDKTFESDVLTMGRATDQLVQLRDRRVALEHARIFRKGKRFYITTSEIAGIVVNEHSLKDSALDVGDVVRVGANILKIIEAPAGADFAFTFELDPEALEDDAHVAALQASLSDTPARKRLYSWAAFLLVGALFFALPLAAFLTRGDAPDEQTPAWMVVDDEVWLSGPLHPAHQGEVANCSDCHEAAFKRVRNESCLACHGASLQSHVRDDLVESSGLDERRCATCHRDHNEPPQLVELDQRLCVDCHADIAVAGGGGARTSDVTDFVDAHPEFQVSVLAWQGADAEEPWSQTRFRLSESAGAERSNLKFDHSAHLDDDGVKAPEGTEFLECGDCHVPEPGGQRLLPVTMEQHCRHCHTLSFESSDPVREVPHGSPAAVVQMLEEYYSYWFLADMGAQASQTRRPARPPRRPGRSATLDGGQRAQAVTYAREMAADRAQTLFETSHCNTCHEVERSTDDNGKVAWDVLPVRLTEAWMPFAVFDHEAHKVQSECGDCHEAVTSELATDVLMPGIESCQACHAGGEAAAGHGQLASTCVMCHNFHQDRNNAWDSELLPAATAQTAAP
jgi:predicted CXXCH cytochrome family protein